MVNALPCLEALARFVFRGRYGMMSSGRITKCMIAVAGYRDVCFVRSAEE